MIYSFLFFLVYSKKIEINKYISRKYRKASVAKVSPYSTIRDLFVTQY